MGFERNWTGLGRAVRHFYGQKRHWDRLGGARTGLDGAGRDEKSSFGDKRGTRRGLGATGGHWYGLGYTGMDWAGTGMKWAGTGLNWAGSAPRRHRPFAPRPLIISRLPLAN